MNLTDNCEMATSNEATRARPNGYISAQFADKTSFYIGEALVDLETIVNATLSKEDIYRLGERAGVQDPTVHRFRHTFAINFLRNGGDIYTLQRILGHSTLTMSKVECPRILLVDIALDNSTLSGVY